MITARDAAYQHDLLTDITNPEYDSDKGGDFVPLPSARVLELLAEKEYKLCLAHVRIEEPFEIVSLNNPSADLDFYCSEFTEGLTIRDCVVNSINLHLASLGGNVTLQGVCIKGDFIINPDEMYDLIHEGRLIFKNVSIAGEMVFLDYL